MQAYSTGRLQLNDMLNRFRGTRTCILHGNGFDFYSFRSQFLYSTTSTPAPTHFLVKYLVDSLGFSNEEAASTSSKVISLKSLKNPHLVINFLKQNGFDNTQMKKLVSRAPKLLIRDVSKTLKPKFQCLMDLGLSGSDLVNVIAKDANIIDRGLDTHLRPTIDCLRRTLGSDENVVKALKRGPWLLTFGPQRTMEANLLLLRNYGVPDEKIRKLVLLYPNYLTQKPERIKDLLHRLENDFQVPRDSPFFHYGFQVLSSQKKSALDRKIGIFKSFGWSDDDILQMFQKLPYCIGLSEVRIQEKLNLFMKELGLGPAYLVSHLGFFIYSLEKRVVPRVQVLKILDEKKLERRNLALSSVLSISESKFIQLFVLPYKAEIPDLYEPLLKIVAP
ncbi:transcription termination factor MTERF5, chloroplastic-like [Solanum dulcamara]|uniref:transcription termination factor MTERF5, chloroplastic-like n=1 Tax=Solanum dulcamara TaxID=45834 RepID=UPI002486580C|nr:transcription termination factor MTERF5, chloroplastic-like [Solanum dulcamara]